MTQNQMIKKVVTGISGIRMTVGYTMVQTPNHTSLGLKGQSKGYGTEIWHGFELCECLLVIFTFDIITFARVM